MAEYIEREKVAEFIKNYGKGAISDGLKTLDPVDDIVMLVKGLDLIPTADVALVVHGEWIAYKDIHKCSVCGFGLFLNGGYYFLNDEYTGSRMPHNYCPNCGAKMDGGTAK